MQRARIICHMVTSLDGRLLTQRWPLSDETILAIYDRAAERLEADGWIVGRHTMEHLMPSGEPAAMSASHPRADRVAGRPGDSLAICFDRQGRLRPESGDLDGDHVVIVLSDRVCDDHVEALAASGVSVFFSGPEGNDIAGALVRISEAFAVQRLLLEGGGMINGAFLADDLIDETSTLILPVVDGKQGGPSIYDHAGELPARKLELVASETVEGGIVWLRHHVVRN